MKTSYRLFSCSFVLALVGLFGACQSPDGNVPANDTNELWPAGITHESYLSTADDQDYYPDSSLLGYIDRQGNMVIEPQYVTAGTFSCGYAPVKLKSSKTMTSPAYVDKSGKIHTIQGLPQDGGALNPAPFYYNSAFVYSSFLSTDDGSRDSWMVDKNINVIGDRIHTGLLSSMTEDGLMACINYKTMEQTYYNRNGIKLLTITAEPVDPMFKDGYVVMRFGTDAQEKKYGIVDVRGDVVYEDSLPLTNWGRQRFLRKHTTKKSADQFDVIDIAGHVLGSEDFMGKDFKQEHLYLVSHTRYEKLYENMPEYYFVNQDGKQVFDRSFYTAEPFVEGYALVSDYDDEIQGLTYELINTKGETVLTFDAGEEALSFHNGLVLTVLTEHMSGRYEFVNHYTYKDLSGKTVYSWDAKALRSKSKQPEKRVHTFPEGQYILGL